MLEGADWGVGESVVWGDCEVVVAGVGAGPEGERGEREVGWGEVKEGE